MSKADKRRSLVILRLAYRDLYIFLFFFFTSFLNQEILEFFIRNADIALGVESVHFQKLLSHVSILNPNFLNFFQKYEFFNLPILESFKDELRFCIFLKLKFGDFAE